MKRLLTALCVIASILSLAATAGASTKGLSKKVRYWYVHENGKRDAKMMLLDYRAIKNDYIALSKSSNQSAATSEASVVGKACDKALQDLVALATTLKPVPDKTLEKRWSKALHDMKSGAASCEAGALALDAGELDRGGRELTSASKLLAKLPFVKDLFART